MTHLRQLMPEELRCRNFDETTVQLYIHGVEQFSQYFHRPPISSAQSTSASTRQCCSQSQNSARTP